MFKKVAFVFLISIFAFSPVTYAGGGPFGAGIILLTPTGFSGKYRLSQNNSIDAAIGWGSHDYVILHSTYLWEFNQAIPLDGKHIGAYFGVGGTFISWDRDSHPGWVDHRRYDDETGLALRASGGLNYYFDRPSFEVFAELALNFFVVPDTEADLGIALGGRYYF